MVKPPLLDIMSSNIAGLGTDLEKNVRENAAACEEQWQNAGKKAGLEVWRIEKFQVKPVDPKEYGHFYTGDSYIILKTDETDSGSLEWNVHFWLGLNTTQDEAGTAAYKTVELDDYLSGAPVQHREVQGFESDHFVEYFPNDAIFIMEGGIDSGFRHVTPEEYRPRLLKVKRSSGKTRVTEVPMEAGNLNGGDIFLLDLGLHVYQMNGGSSTGMERMKAGQVARALDDERDGIEIHVAEQGDGDEDFWPEFWKHLGGEDAIPDKEDEVETPEPGPKKLFRLSDADGSMDLEEVASGDDVKHDLLQSSDVFILDAGHEVFVWVGLDASAGERKGAMQRAQDYLSKNNRPFTLPISRVLEGGENEAFKASF